MEMQSVAADERLVAEVSNLGPLASVIIISRVVLRLRDGIRAIVSLLRHCRWSESPRSLNSAIEFRHRVPMVGTSL